MMDVPQARRTCWDGGGVGGIKSTGHTTSSEGSLFTPEKVRTEFLLFLRIAVSKFL